MLLLDANHVVSTETLIDGLWGDEPPPTAAAALQTHMAKLRQALASVGGDQLVETRAPGYIICVDPDALDLAEFDVLADRGRATSDPAVAAALFRRALDVWRGAPLADLAYEPFALGAIARLEEERLAVLEDRVEADLDRGAHAEIIGELRELVDNIRCENGCGRADSGFTRLHVRVQVTLTRTASPTR